MMFSRKVFCGATKPLRPPGIFQLLLLNIPPESFDRLHFDISLRPNNVDASGGIFRGTVDGCFNRLLSILCALRLAMNIL